MAVVELSSFQLLSMRQSPEIAVVTNVTPNHLDVHGTMEEYIAAKKNIFLHQGAFTATVLNADCPTTAGFAAEVRGDCRWFSRRHPVERGAWLDDDGTLHDTDGSGDTPLFSMSEIKIPGLHNVENMLTAIAAVWGLVPPEIIRRVAETFPGVEHRIEFVRELDGVRWYNDSIATSPTRTIAGLESFDRKLIIIGLHPACRTGAAPCQGADFDRCDGGKNSGGGDHPPRLCCKRSGAAACRHTGRGCDDRP